VSGIEHYAKEYQIDQLQEQIWELQVQLNRLEMKLDRVMYQPTIEPYSGGTTCAKCGIRWEGAMAYVCIQPGCPVQMQVTRQI
jgi:hypothetical protein